jgi:hypothetical protein
MKRTVTKFNYYDGGKGQLSSAKEFRCAWVKGKIAIRS